jgi:hypothetical protein
MVARRADRLPRPPVPAEATAILRGVPDPLAIWGATTGTAGLGIALRREIWSSKRRLRVANGWQFVFVKNDDGGQHLADVWVYVMAWNTGRRPLHIEHAGFEFVVEGSRRLAEAVGAELGPDNRVWMNARIEIALNAETFEVIPDGPSVKLWTRIQPILAFGIHPMETRMQPYVVTVPEQYWWGEEGPLLPSPPQGMDSYEASAAVGRLATEYVDEHGKREFTGEEPGEVHGVPRLILEGDVERSGDLLSAATRTEEPGESRQAER